MRTRRYREGAARSQGHRAYQGYQSKSIPSIGWIARYERQGQKLQDFPNLKEWFERMLARKAVAKGLALGEDEGTRTNLVDDKDTHKLLFGQTARK